MGEAVDLLLVRCRLAAAEDLAEAARTFCAQSGLPLVPQRLAWSRDSGWAYLYVAPPRRIALDASVPRQLAGLWAAHLPSCGAVDVSRMELLQDLPGQSHGATPARHYVVETDPEQGWDEEIARWYVQEHMPGLARVAGCVDARRLRNHDAGPASHACYSLLTEDTLGSPPWLAVRNSAWSSRVRPHFTNTRRTMMEIVPTLP
jgi:hypothetical protein